jgi:drug/metabolite transporter (DMT)-like permease
VDNKLWLVYSIAAGLCWGTYVPFVQQGIRGLGSAYGSFLCVGIAYFLIAVLFPIALFMMGEKTPVWNVSGATFATLAGVAGALGALCVIYANRSARGAPEYRLYIAPIIFAMAPVINTILSMFWHPSKGAFHFGLEYSPSWKLYVGILLTGLGAALVLYSKEETEGAKPAPSPTAVAPSSTSPS